MKKTLMIIFLIVLSNTVIAQWTKLPLCDSFYKVGDAYFLNKDTGYLYGWGQYSSGDIKHQKNPYHLISTTDGGNTFTVIDSNASVVNLGSIYFSDYYNGLVIRTDYKINKRMLFSTHNAGKTWDSIPGTEQFSQITFITKNLGFATRGGVIMTRTIDGGKTWKNIPGNLLYAKDFWLNKNSLFLYFPDDTLHGYSLFAENDTSPVKFYKVYKTDDAGATWKNLNINYSFFTKFYPMPYFFKNHKILAYNVFYKNTDTAYMSYDDGKTWVYYYFPRAHNNVGSNYYFLDTNNIYASSPRPDYVLRKTDSTKIWGTQDIDFSYINMNMRIIDLNTYTLEGGNIDKVFITSNKGGAITSKQLTIPIITTIAIQIFPNPTHGQATTAVVTGLKQQHSATMELRSMEGKHINSYTLKPDNTGTVNKQLDVSALQCGVYILSVQQGEERVSKEVVVK